MTTRRPVRADVVDGEPVDGLEALGDQGPVARLGVALDAEEAGGPGGRQEGDDLVEVGPIEDLRDVALAVGGGERDARALADPLAVVVGVLDLAELGGRGELPPVGVVDLGGGQGGRQAPGVGPGVLGARTPRRWRTSRTSRTSARRRPARNVSSAKP